MLFITKTKNIPFFILFFFYFVFLGTESFFFALVIFARITFRRKIPQNCVHNNVLHIKKARIDFFFITKPYTHIHTHTHTHTTKKSKASCFYDRGVILSLLAFLGDCTTHKVSNSCQYITTGRYDRHRTIEAMRLSTTISASTACTVNVGCAPCVIAVSRPASWHTVRSQLMENKERTCGRSSRQYDHSPRKE